MTAFTFISGGCGIIAFLVLCWQGARTLRTETARLFTVDGVRALMMAERACDEAGVSYSILQGTVSGIEVTGPAYKIGNIRSRGDLEGWRRVL